MRQRILAIVATLGSLSLAATVKTAELTVDPANKDVKSLATARDAGEAPDYAVYKAERSDGGSVYYGLSKTDAGEKITFIDRSPCRRRPAKAAKGTCTIRLSDGGERDFGDNNVMQAGQWVDHGGCEESPCAVFFGSKNL